MPEERPARFKSRFSLLSLLPARHPPLDPTPPPLPPLTHQRLPPTRNVPALHPTVVSVDDTISPVQSEYPLSAYINGGSGTDSPPILPRFNVPPVPRIPPSYASTRTPPSRAGSCPASSKKSKSPKRPPPLDLRRTREAYPGIPGVIPTAGTTAPPVPPVPVKKGKEKERPAKPKKVVDDPFDFVELESTHHYPSWQGGRVSIKPGQVIPKGLVPKSTPTIRGLNPAVQRCQKEDDISPEYYGSVLHDILLTPTYNRISPAIPPTPSPVPSEGQWGARQARRKTVLDAIKRGSRHVTKGLHGAERTLRELRDRDAQEMSRFRDASRPIRVRSHDPSTAYSTSSPMPRGKGAVYARKSPGSREYDVGVRFVERVEKSRSDSKMWKDKKAQDKAKKRQKLSKYGILILIICLVALTIGLCATLLNKSSSKDLSTSTATNGTNSTATSASSSASATPSATVSRTLTSCLDTFHSSAPNSPTTYPCSDCVPLLTSTTNDYSYALSNGNSSGVGAALQFCALADVYRSTEGSGLEDAGWMKDASPCEWEGVTCDGRGRITELQLQYPNVPDKLPFSLSNVVSLQSFRLMGNTSVPAGSFPSSFLSLANFTTLDVEYTSLSGKLSDMEFSKAAGLSSLVLVNNAQLGTSLPSLTSNGALKTLVITGQGLTSISESSLSTSITYLDLSYNALSRTIPSFSSLSGLQTLYLTNNDLTAAPASLPGALTSLSFTSNTNLAGSMPASTCLSSNLTSCDLRSTSLTGPIKSATTIGGTATTTITTSAAATSSGSTLACGVCRF